MKYFCTVLFFLFYAFIIGQDRSELSAEQIIDSSLIFCGREGRIAKITSTEITYSITQPDGSKARCDEKVLCGRKYVQSILSKVHVPQTTFFNGGRISRVTGDSVLHIGNIEKKEEIRLRTYAQIQYGYKMLGYSLSRMPDQKFEHFDCYVVSAKASHGYTLLNYFDKTNFRLLMIMYPSGNKSLFMEYQFKDSVLFNSKIVNTFANSEDLQTFQLVGLHLNNKISDLWFNCPYNNKVFIPENIKVGKFISSNGPKTQFTRTATEQDYFEEGQMILRRHLKWKFADAFVATDGTEPEILIRIIAWDKGEYVCQWINGKYSDTQDYKMIK